MSKHDATMPLSVAFEDRGVESEAARAQAQAAKAEADGSSR